MYYEEKLINGILSYRTHPDDPWQEISKEKLSKDLLRKDREIKRKDKAIEEALNQLYVDMDGIGSLFVARQILQEALSEERTE